MITFELVKLKPLIKILKRIKRIVSCSQSALKTNVRNVILINSLKLVGMSGRNFAMVSAFVSFFVRTFFFLSQNFLVSLTKILLRTFGDLGLLSRVRVDRLRNRGRFLVQSGRFFLVNLFILVHQIFLLSLAVLDDSGDRHADSLRNLFVRIAGRLHRLDFGDLGLAEFSSLTRRRILSDLIHVRKLENL